MKKNGTDAESCAERRAVHRADSFAELVQSSMQIAVQKKMAQMQIALLMQHIMQMFVQNHIAEVHAEHRAEVFADRRAVFRA